MIKKILFTALVCLLCVCLFTACNPKENEEEILPEQTILISTAADLVGMQQYTGIKYSKYIFQLENDIDLSNIAIWEPIGKDITKAFMGKFDGNGHTIANLTLKGWEGSGNPIFIGEDTKVVNETSYCSIGLFGYTKDTDISNLTLSGVNIYYYTEGTASYTAALVGYDVGRSKFSNITTDGSIDLANIFTKVKTYDNKGNEQGYKEACPTVQYMAGVVAYSSGNGTFDNISSSVVMQNALYKAIYREADEENQITEGYTIRTDDDKSVLPEQVFAGGVLGLFRGATINNINSSASMRIKAKSSYLGGAIAALYDSEAKNINVADINICGKVTTKNTVGGAVALLDHSSFADSVLANIIIDEQCQANEVQSSSVGGAVGYAYDGSVIDNIAIDELLVGSMYNKSVLGGILAIVRDSVLKNCTVDNGKFKSNNLSKNDSLDAYNNFYKSCGVIVGAIYGNATVAECSGQVENKFTYYKKEGGVNVVYDEYENNYLAYGTKDSTTYVNEDGYDAVRFFKKGSLTQYIVAYATYSEGNLNVIFYSEESQILAEETYSNVAVVAGTDSDSTKYKDTFFTAGVGIVNANGEVIAFDGRDTSKYVYLSGVPNIDEDTIRIKVIK